MGPIKILYLILSFLKSSFKLSIYGEDALVELCIISVINITIFFLHYNFNKNVKEEYSGTRAGSGQSFVVEDAEEVEKEEEIVIPDAFKKEYNFLTENSKSLTTLFENYILRRVSHDTLLRQFQASQENTFLQMRSRVRTELDLPKEIKDKSCVHSDDLSLEDSDTDIADDVLAGFPIFGTGERHRKLLGLNSPPVKS